MEFYPFFNDGKRQQHTEERYLIRCLRSHSLLSDVNFKMTFRISKGTFEMLLLELAPHLKVGQKKYSISQETKLLTTLHFLAQGSYQLSITNETHGHISKSAFSSILHEVINVMNFVLCPNHISFPNFREIKITMDKVLQAYKIPGVIGFIDGTHIQIAGPKYPFPEFVFVNKKNFHSINVQVICDHQYRFININAKFPGSTNDSHIWRMSQARAHILMQFQNKRAWLLGDSGYPLEPNLIVPFRLPLNAGGELFNKQHKVAHATVGCCIVNITLVTLVGKGVACAWAAMKLDCSTSGS